MSKIHKKKIKIALTGGFSGGHCFPLLSLYNYLKEEGEYSFIWVGEENSLEETLAKKAGIKFQDISAGKIRRYLDYRNLYEPLKNLTGIFEGIYYIFKKKIDIVFSKGGYVSLPLCIAAKIFGKKIYVHESDTIGGVSNRLIGILAHKIFYSFPNDKIQGELQSKRGSPGENGIKHILTGQILNPEIIDSLKNLKVEQNNELNVVITGGSQGSKIIFEALLKALPELQNIQFQIILGEKNMNFRPAFKKFPNTLVHDFVTQKRLGKILKNTDIAITRGGATTLWELNVFGIHSIIIPLKNSAGNHQAQNAKYFKENFGSNILNEENNLDKEIIRLLQNFKNLRKAGLNLEGFFKPLQIIEKEIKS